MTYVLSDIHGNLQRFDKMLKKIKFNDSDTMYILGDVVDHHPFGITLLKKIMKMQNVHMLLGNHEFMMMRALGFPYDGENDITESRYKLLKHWYRNGGRVTDIEWYTTPERVKKAIKKYLKGLPLSYDIKVSGKKFKLVHAVPFEWYEMFGEGIYETRTCFAVWDREAIKVMNIVPKTNYTLIFGHTPTLNFQKANPPRIYYSKNKIGIDCACGHIDPHGLPKALRVNGRLACLRLDDMKEYYVR